MSTLSLTLATVSFCIVSLPFIPTQASQPPGHGGHGPPPHNPATHPPTPEHGTPPPSNGGIHSVFDPEWDETVVMEHHKTRCGNGFAIASQSICCANNIVKVAEGKNQCCMAESFNPDTSFCCNQKVVNNRIEGMACCGDTTLYIKTEKICCAGTLLDRGANTACCGTTAYSQATQLCCAGKLQKKGLHSACCGTQPFSPMSAINACCGNKVVYNPKTHFCCQNERAMMHIMRDMCKPKEHFIIT